MEHTEKIQKPDFTARKTFFVGAGNDIVPDEYLEAFLTLGLETYRIFEQHSAPDIAERLNLIVSLFGNVTFVFYVDAFSTPEDWVCIMKCLHENHAGLALGVMYTERALEAENKAIEEMFSPFCASDFARLSFKRSQNFKPIASYLSHLSAGGMRRTVRALCGAQSTVTFLDIDFRTEAQVQDISLSHFSCIVPNDATLSKHYSDVVIYINGMRFLADCTFIAERQTSHGRLCVFAFVRKNGAAGLEDSSLTRLRPKLYQMVTQNALEVVKEAFTLRTKLVKVSGESTSINATVLSTLQTA